MSDAARTVVNAQQAQDAAAANAGNDQAGPQGRVAELRVSAHLMRLEAGVFCVFPVPGSPRPDPETGLPGVRISQAPGPAAAPGAVSISTFRDDGWLDGTAALVRVASGPASILVTIYQGGPQSAVSAPRLQVMQLSGDPNAAAEPGPAQARSQLPNAAMGVPDPEAMAHVQSTGDVGGQFGDWVGVKGSRLWIEGFGLSPHKDIAPADIEYQAVLGRGWLSPWVDGGKYCGSRGMALPLLGLKVRLKADAALAFDCSYSATFVDGSAIGPVPAGESCEAESLSALESFRIVLHPRGSGPAPNKSGARTAARPASAPLASAPLTAKPGTAKPGTAKPGTAKPKGPARVVRR